MSAAHAERDAGGAIWAPLRVGAFRNLWLANLASNFGYLIQGVGAGWMMTLLTPNPAMVALVQTSMQLPILVFALLAGALADLIDHRKVLIAAQVWMLGVALVLATLGYMGLVTPWLLLGFTFLLGMGMAVNGPTMQATVRGLVPANLLAAAITLNAVSFNLARATGPAIGGGIVSAAGPEAAFLVNALTYLPLLLVLLLWRRPARAGGLPRERVLPAMLTGLRYVGQTPAIWHTMGRGALFGFAATSIMALMPLVAKDALNGGPSAFGGLLGAFGVGALGGAFAIQPIRQRLGVERSAAVMAGLFGGALIAVGLMPSWTTAILALLVMGACWLGSLSSFNVGVQMSSAFWVQARVLSVYQMVLFGGMALGSWVWGEVAGAYGVLTALVAAGCVMLGQLLLQPFLTLPSDQAPDMRPANRREALVTEVPVPAGEGPVMIQVEYRVVADNVPAFLAAMDEFGHQRRRNGALRWRLFQDVSDADHWIETFLVADWLDQRRLLDRTTTADLAIEAEALRYHEGNGEGDGPIVRRMIARRRDSRYALTEEERGDERAAADDA